MIGFFIIFYQFLKRVYVTILTVLASNTQKCEKVFGYDEFLPVLAYVREIVETLTSHGLLSRLNAASGLQLSNLGSYYKRERLHKECVFYS